MQSTRTKKEEEKSKAPAYGVPLQEVIRDGLLGGHTP